MLFGIITVVVGVFVALAALYFLAPGAIFAVSVVLGRMKGGLKLKTIDIDDHTISYLAGGEGESLLLLHGFGADKDNWTLVAPYLKRSFTMIIPDLPGFGESSFRSDASYSIDSQVERLVLFVEKLGITKLHIGGNSMGGYLAVALANRLRQSVESLWLLAPAGVTTDEKAEGVILIEQDDNPLIIKTEEDLDRLIQLCFEKPPFTPNPIKHFLLERAKERADTNQNLFHDLIGGELPQTEDNPLQLENLVGEMRTTTLLVWGDKDRILHPSGLQVLSGKLQVVKTIMMSDMGHVPMVERPEQTAIDFLNFSKK